MKIQLFLLLTWYITTEHASVIKLNSPGFEVPIFSVNFNTKVIDIPVIAEGITQAENVTCSPISSSSPSSTTGFFGITELTPTVKHGYLPYICTGFGKRIQIHCHIKNLHNSSGNAGYLECRKPPVVSVEPDLIFLMSRSTPFIYKVQVFLSEPTIDDVEILCSTANQSALQLSTESLLVPQKTTSATLVVNITAAGPGDQTTLSCSARSLNGTQYQLKNSIGNSATIRMVNEELTLHPEHANFNRLHFKLSLIPHGITRDLSLFCQVEQADSEADADVLYKNPVCHIQKNTSQPGNNWKVRPNNVDFKVSAAPATIQTLEVSRSGYSSVPDVGALELLVITCCSATPTLRAAARIDVLLPNPPLNIAEDSISSGAQVVLPNPAFNNIATCPCDLTLNECDIGCCCDQLCPAGQPTPCFLGLFGGDFSNLDTDSSTQSQYEQLVTSLDSMQKLVSSSGATFESQREYGLRGLLCVSRNNGAFLGHFYPQKSVATSDSQLDENYATRGRSVPSPGLSEYGLRHSVDGGSSLKYYEGDPLMVERRAARLSGSSGLAVSSTLERAALLLPESSNCEVPSGGPINFLQNQERYRCPIEISKTACHLLQTTGSISLPGKGPHSIVSRLSVKAYLLGDEIVNYQIPNAYRIRTGPLSSTHAPTTVNYFCLTDDEVATYSTTPFMPEFASNASGFFDQNCTYDQRTLQTTCKVEKPLVDVCEVNASPCSWDNGYELATPEVHGDICQNVVLGVDYRFLWTDGYVTGAEADIFLANVNMSANGAYYQTYSVLFVNQSGSGVRDYRASSAVGYKPGSELVTGLRKDLLPGQFEVELETAGSSGVVNPAPDNLCGPSGRELSKFGQNSVGACRITLNISAFSDCVKLRSLMVARLNNLIPSELVAVFQSPSSTDPDDWVEVQKEPILVNVSSNMDTVHTGSCNQVPSGISLDVFYSMQGRVLGEPIWLIVGAQVSYRNSTWTISCDSSGLYSECRDGSGQPYSDAGIQRSFTLFTQVTYTEVPADWSERIRKVMYKLQPFTRETVPRDEYALDISWKETFYAWSNYDRMFGLYNETATPLELIASLGVGAVGLTLVLMIGSFR